MTPIHTAKFFIFFATLLAITNQNSTHNELGVDRCSHEHFKVVNTFFQDSIWSHFPNPTFNYRFVECSREAHIGSYLRQYVFGVEIGEVKCNFSFKVKDVVTEKTLANFSPLEIKDYNSCKHALQKANIIAIQAEKADEEDWSNLQPLFRDIETKTNKNHHEVNDEVDLDASSLFADEHKAYETKTNEEMPTFLNILERDEPRKKRINLLEESSEEDSLDEDNTPVKHFIAGGFSKCNKGTLQHIPKLFTALANQNVLKGVVIYAENIIHCQAQVVKGMNYKVEVSLNEEVCSYTIYEDITGEVSLSSESIEASPVCRAYLTESYIRANTKLV